MPNARDVKNTVDNLRCMVVGDVGTGKSCFAASFPTPGFIFDFDGGILSYRDKDFDYEQYAISPAGWMKFELDANKFIKDSTKYKTLIIDSTSAWADMAMTRSLQLSPLRSPEGGPIWNVHYAMVKNLIGDWTRKLLSFPGNVVLISHVNTTKDDTTGAVMKKPAISGNLSERLPGYFDEVYYTITKRVGTKTEYLLQTVAIGYYHARSRLSGIEHRLTDTVPNQYQAIMDQLSKHSTEGSKK